MDKKKFKRPGLVHMHTYLPDEMYEDLKTIAVGNTLIEMRWESAVLRQAIAEFIKNHQKQRRS